MIELSRFKIQENEYLNEIETLASQNVFACYACSKCSAGCPLVDKMDVLPHQIMKLLQMGAEKELEASNTADVCASCFVCSTRCPKGVRITEVMEAIRVVKTRRNIDIADLNDIDPEELKRMPPIALVANQRKLGH